MKKQVTFAESQTVHRLHQDEALPRSTGMNESKMVLKESFMNFNNGVKISRPPAARCEPQLQHETTVQIPKTMTAAPFLKHSALTPAQKEYLYTIAASYSATHVRNLITQHYMNVLHRCIRAGHSSEDDDLVRTLPRTDESNEHRSAGPSRAKQKEKINASAKNPGKSFLPKIPNRRARLTSTSASKQRNMKKRTTASPTLRRKSPRRATMRLLEKEEDEEEEEDEGLDDSLSECLSSISMTDWDDDTFSDLSQ